MKRNKLFVVTVSLALLALTAGPALAGQHDRGRGRENEGSAVARDNGGARHGEAAPAQAPRVEAPPPAQRAEAPRPVAPRAEAPGSIAQHSWDGRRDGYGRAVPRQEVVPRTDRSIGVAPRVERPVVIAPRADRRVVVAPRAYSRPFYYGAYGGFRPGYRPYVFRPYIRISSGFFLGYSVPYVYSYPYPVPVYGYGAPSAPVYITPNSSMYGGVSFEITPPDAQAFVDGQYVGLVRDFDGVGAPLNLTAGRHAIELSAPGFEPLAFDVDVVPGQLVPYHGDMQPARW